MPSSIVQKDITIQDVADRAGVSKATVSRVLNDHSNVAMRTRSRVRDAIRALDYEPNQLARTLASGGELEDPFDGSEDGSPQTSEMHLTFEGDWTEAEREMVEKSATESESWLCVKTRLNGGWTFVALEMNQSPPKVAQQNSARKLAHGIMET